MKTEKLYTENLSILKWRFWDLAIQKIIRSFTSMKFILFNQIFVATIIFFQNKLLTGAQFTTIVVSGLTVMVSARVLTDMRLEYDDSKEDNKEDTRINKRKHRQLQEDLYDDLYK